MTAGSPANSPPPSEQPMPARARRPTRSKGRKYKRDSCDSLLYRVSKCAAMQKTARKTGNRPSRLRADVATKIGDNPQTSLPGSKVDSSEAEAVRSVINIPPTKDIGHNLHRLRVSLVGATVGIVYGRAGATHMPVRCRPLDQWLRALTYDAGTVSASADLLSVSLLIPRFPHGGRERARRV
jgi:hypothetical protein